MNHASGSRDRDEIAGARVVDAERRLPSSSSTRSTPGVRFDQLRGRATSSRRIVHVDVRDLVIRDGERRAGAGVEQLQAQLLATAINPCLRRTRLRCTGVVTSQSPYSDRTTTCTPRAFEEGDQIAAELVDLPDVVRGRRLRRADALQVVVEVRQVDQRQRRRELLFDVLGALRRSSCVDSIDGPRSPEVEQRERAELSCSSSRRLAGRGVDVRQLPAVGGIHRPRRDV